MNNKTLTANENPTEFTGQMEDESIYRTSSFSSADAHGYRYRYYYSYSSVDGPYASAYASLFNKDLKSSV